MKAKEGELLAMVKAKDDELRQMMEEFGNLDAYTTQLQLHLEKAQEELNNRLVCPHCHQTLE